MLILIPILIFVALVIVGARRHRSAEGYHQWTVLERFGRYAKPTAGLSLVVPFIWTELVAVNMMEQGAGYSVAGGDLKKITPTSLSMRSVLFRLSMRRAPMKSVTRNCSDH